MGLLKWKRLEESTEDLQAELLALCQRMTIATKSSDFDRYENLLAELYKRKVEPIVLLK